MEYLERLALVPATAWYMMFLCVFGLMLVTAEKNQQTARKLIKLFLFVTTLFLGYSVAAEIYRLEQLVHPFGLVVGVPLTGFFIIWCCFVYHLHMQNRKQILCTVR